MLYPKMFVTPDYTRQKQLKEQQQKTGHDIRLEVDKRQKSVDDMARKQKALGKEMNSKLISQAQNIENNRADTRKRQASETCRNWHEHTAAREIQRQVRKETFELCNDIVYGEFADHKKVKPVVEDPLIERKQVTMKKQRANAERRAKDNQLKPTRVH